MQRFQKRDIIFVSSLLILSILLPFILLCGGSDEGKYVAAIYTEGKEVCRLPLDADSEYLVQTDRGRNLVVVKNGKVYISEADCPGEDCVHTGAVSERSTIPLIACLPHRLIVQIEIES